MRSQRLDFTMGNRRGMLKAGDKPHGETETCLARERSRPISSDEASSDGKAPAEKQLGGFRRMVEGTVYSCRG
jgi:hypothetical protein